MGYLEEGKEVVGGAMEINMKNPEEEHPFEGFS